MRVKEVLGTLFYEINKIYVMPFGDLIYPEELDKLYIFKYGERLMLDRPELTAQDYAQLCVNMYRESWTQVFEILTMKRPQLKTFLEEVTETTTENGTTQNNGTNTSTQNNLNKVSGFNSDSLVDNEAQENLENSTSQNTENKDNKITKTYSRSGFQGDYIKSLEDEIKFLKLSYIDGIIFKDVNNLLTISIFD